MLNESTIYLGDNGRAFCGSLRCAGATAHASGRDISGQRVMPLDDAAKAEAKSQGILHLLKCEGCGRGA